MGFWWIGKRELSGEPPEARGTAYVVKSLEAALWAVYRSYSFREGCLVGCEPR